jgi:hypothetical protein
MLSEFDFKVVHKPGVDNEMDCRSLEEAVTEEAVEASAGTAAVCQGAGGVSREGVQVSGGGPGAGGGSQLVSVPAAPVQDVWQDWALLSLLRGRG